jgi:hypothetical protein
MELRKKMDKRKEYSTVILPLACYLKANQSLRYICCRLCEGSTSQAEFVFADPTGVGIDQKNDYMLGQAQVDPREFYNALLFLRKELTQATGGVR